MLAPKLNPLLAVDELRFVKQGSMDSGEFHAHITKIVKRCKFPCTKADERVIRDTIFLGINSTKAKAFPQGVSKQEKSHPEGSPHASPQDDDETHIDENGVRQPNPPPRVNMLKVVKHTKANRGKFNERNTSSFP